ncbi:unnamed protein product [Auanema sp. JU1783]|nr:unnamed protein product [Auanema sp. JU1783]
MIEQQIRLEVDSTELKLKPITYRLIKLLDITWSFELRKCSPYSMEVLVGYLKCKNIRNHSLKVNYFIKIKSKVDSHYDGGRKVLEFNKTRASSCVLSTRWKKIAENDEFCSKKGKFEVFITLSFVNLMDENDINGLCYFGSNLHLSDVAFLINSQKVYAHRQFLALHSDYFKAMFYSEFIESKQFEICLRDVDEKDFIEMLQVIYPDQTCLNPIKYGNIHKLLEVADKFSMRTVVKKCEEFLMADLIFPFMEKFQLAEKHQLVRLQEQLIRQMHKSQLTKLLRKQDFHHFSHGTLVQILGRTKELLS